MQRYFIPTTGWVEDKKINITDEDAHHISNVMRMKVNDRIICCNPLGHSALCQIEEITNSNITCHVVEWLNEEKELPVKVTIAQGLPKGDKLDLIVQKGTELGAYAFIPFSAERSVVKWDQKKAEKKLTRLSKIAKEASEQSHRTRIPVINHFVTFKEFLKLSEHYKHKIVASEVEAKRENPDRLGNYIKQMNPTDEVLVVIGPEGGFSNDELDILGQEGFQFTRFGPRILRTETAALYFLATMSYHFEELR